MSVSGVFVAVGLRPNTGYLKGLLTLDEGGFIVVNGQMETSVPGVFAAGEAFVVRHRKDGTPRSGTVLAREHGGARVLAAIDLAPQELEDLEAAEVVGTRWMCRHDTASGKNLAQPA